MDWYESGSIEHKERIQRNSQRAGNNKNHQVRKSNLIVLQRYIVHCIAACITVPSKLVSRKTNPNIEPGELCANPESI